MSAEESLIETTIFGAGGETTSPQGQLLDGRWRLTHQDLGNAEGITK